MFQVDLVRNEIFKHVLNASVFQVGLENVKMGLFLLSFMRDQVYKMKVTHLPDLSQDIRVKIFFVLHVLCIRVYFSVDHLMLACVNAGRAQFNHSRSLNLY